MRTPPRLLRRLVEAMLPPGRIRDNLVGDLDELYGERVARQGRVRADAWYVRQVVVVALRWIPARLARSGEGQGPGWEGVWRQVRFGARSLLRAPAFSATVVAVLALGVGGTTAVFSVVRSVLLEPLPYSESDRLVRVYQRDADEATGDQFVTGAHFVAWREGVGSFGEIAASYTYRETGADLTLDAGAERVRMLRVSAGYFDVLRRTPARGRTFTREEEADVPLAVLSHELWRRLGASADAVGQAVDLDGTAHEIVGVMPPGTRDPVVGTIDVWVPLDLREGDSRLDPGNHYLTVLARLAPGAGLERARSELSAVDDVLAERWPEREERSWLVPLQEDLVGDARPLLRLLLAAVGLLLILVCVDVAGLLLVRTTTRSRELALRMALGAGRRRIAGQLIVESLVLALAGGALGTALAPALVKGLVGLGAEAIPRTSDVTVDGPVLLFAGVLTLLTGVAFGTFPALAAVGSAPGRALVVGSRGSSWGRASLRARSVLVAVQMALALVLLTGATVLAASVHRLGGVDLGARTEGVLTFELNLPAARYDPGARDALHRTVAGRLAGLPGVEAVGAVSRLPATGNYHNWGMVALSGPEAGKDDWWGAQQRVVSGDYFTAMEIEVLAGRVFDDGDDARAPRRAVISRSAAEALFPGVPAVGQRLEAGGNEMDVIGVVEDVAVTPEGEPGRYVYHAHAQFADNRNWNLTYTVATSLRPEGLLPAIRAEIAAVDRSLVVHRPAAMADVLGRGRSRRRFAFALTAGFAGLALTLAILGLYGVVSYGVRQRTREIGIRMALGADAASVRDMVLRQSALVVLPGLVLGVAGSSALGRLLAALVFETDPGDPRLLAGAALALGACAMMAVWLPVRRAVRVEPRVALGGD